MNTVADQENQTALLDLSGREYNVMFVDENQPLFVANSPLHWKAHKLQIALSRMDKQAEKNPAQFNSTTYFSALDKLAQIMEEINEKEQSGQLGSSKVAGSGDGSGTPTVGERVAAGVDLRISANNPLAG